MQPNQSNQLTTKLSLNKTVVTALTKEGMLNYGGNGANLAAMAPATIETHDSCFSCNSLIPDGCGTGTTGNTGIMSW